MEKAEKKEDSKTVYSYHTFIFPFVWNHTDNKLDFDGICKLFLYNDYWRESELDLSRKSADNHPGHIIINDSIPDSSENKLCDHYYEDRNGRSVYAEYRYYYPQVRKAIFGSEENSIYRCFLFDYENTHNKAQYCISKSITKEKENGKKEEYTINLEYILSVNNIKLKIYNTGVALYILECENARYSSLADIKNINDMGRRITLPFIPYSDKSVEATKYNKYSVCADKLLLKHKDAEYTESFKEAIHAGKRFELEHVGSIILDILSKGTGKRFIPVNSLNVNSGKNPDSVFISTAFDDRMFVSCIIVSPDITNYFLSPSYKGNFRYLDDIQTEKSLYELMFNDPEGGCTCCNSEMRRQLIDSHLYKRWTDTNSLYSITFQSLICITDGEFSPIVDYFLTSYTDMMCLCLVQLASIIMFQNEASELAIKIESSENKSSFKNWYNKTDRVSNVRRLMKLQERVSVFRGQLFFEQLTSQEQGIEMYNMFRQAYMLNEEMDNTVQQIDSLNSSADTYIDLNFNKIGYIFAYLGALLALTQVIFPMFIDIQTKPLIKIIVSVITVIISGVVFFVFMKYYRRKINK